MSAAAIPGSPEQDIPPGGEHARIPVDFHYLVAAGRAGDEGDISAPHTERVRDRAKRGFRRLPVDGPRGDRYHKRVTAAGVVLGAVPVPGTVPSADRGPRGPRLDADR